MPQTFIAENSTKAFDLQLSLPVPCNTPSAIDRPFGHRPAALLPHIAAAVSCLDHVRDGMRQSHLRHLVRAGLSYDGRSAKDNAVCCLHR